MYMPSHKAVHLIFLKSLIARTFYPDLKQNSRLLFYMAVIVKTLFFKAVQCVFKRNIRQKPKTESS